MTATDVVTTAWVNHWSSRYEVSEREKYLLSDVASAVRHRGFLTRDEFLEVGRWKSARAKNLLAANAEDAVRDITELALRCRLELKVGVLSVLSGVGRPMAAAVLTVADQTSYTMIDFRTVRSYPALGLLPIDWSKARSYADYVMRLREQAQCLDVSLRELDRAVFMWDKRRNGAHP